MRSICNAANDWPTLREQASHTTAPRQTPGSVWATCPRGAVYCKCLVFVGKRGLYFESFKKIIALIRTTKNYEISLT